MGCHLYLSIWRRPSWGIFNLLKLAKPSWGNTTLVDPNKTVPLQDLVHHAVTTLPTPHCSLDSPDNSQCPLSPDTDPTVISLLFTHPPSWKSAEKIDTLSFNQVMLRLRPQLDGIAGECRILLKGVSPNDVEKLQEMSRASKLPGWENLSDFFSSLWWWWD